MCFTSDVLETLNGMSKPSAEHQARWQAKCAECTVGQASVIVMVVVSWKGHNHPQSQRLGLLHFSVAPADASGNPDREEWDLLNSCRTARLIQQTSLSPTSPTVEEDCQY